MRSKEVEIEIKELEPHDKLDAKGKSKLEKLQKEQEGLKSV
jgi:hypothetical protein